MAARLSMKKLLAGVLASALFIAASESARANIIELGSIDFVGDLGFISDPSQLFPPYGIVTWQNVTVQSSSGTFASMIPGTPLLMSSPLIRSGEQWTIASWVFNLGSVGAQVQPGYTLVTAMAHWSGFAPAGADSMFVGFDPLTGEGAAIITSEFLSPQRGHFQILEFIRTVPEHFSTVWLAVPAALLLAFGRRRQGKR